MTHLITQYLLQYKRVTLPHWGTLEIHQQPAELNFVEKLLSPPRYTGVLKEADEVPGHQLDFLMQASGEDKNGVEAALASVGERLRKKMSGGRFSWNGLGPILAGGLPFSLEFQPWQPVTAEKVSREDATHHVLVGDREIIAGGNAAVEEEILRRRSVVMIVAWILLALGASVALWLLFTGRFSITSFGLRSAP